MGTRKIAIVTVLSCLTLGACQHPGQNNYNVSDVGQSVQVDFGTIIAEHSVHITGQNAGLGAAGGRGSEA